MEEKERRVFINSENKATFVCQKCAKSKTVDVSKYQAVDRAVRVKIHCTCGHNYRVLLERRKSFRKDTRLSGVYIFGPKKHRGPIAVKDLSRTGVKFEVLDRRVFQPGHRLMIEFHLDDSQRTLIRKEVVVRSLFDRLVGAEFTSISSTDINDKKIAFYVMP